MKRSFRKGLQTLFRCAFTPWRLGVKITLPVALVAVLTLFARCSSAAEWQWSVPAPTIPDRRAFLWVPPDCPRVRGLVVAVQNMLEQPLFERPAFRDICAENDLGIVMVYSGHDRIFADDKDPNHPKRSALDLFLNPEFPKGAEDPKGAGEDLQQVLDALAEESGYDEIRYAPLMLVGHSSAGSFVWHLHQWNPSRIFAIMPFKTGIKTDGPQGIPIFDVESEWFEFGNDAHDMWLNPRAKKMQLAARANGDQSLLSFYVDIGSGHCNASDDAIPLMGLFIKKAVAARIPREVPASAPVAVKPIEVESGWLLDPEKLGKPEGQPVAYRDWPGDPKKAFWYFDREMAAAVQEHMTAQLAKKPQFIGFVDKGRTNTSAAMFRFDAKFIDGAGTFKLEAVYLDHATNNLLPPETKFDHPDSPILYRVNSGGVVQVASNIFRICPHAGPLVPQGNPWEPTLVAYNLGDSTFRPMDHSAHAYLTLINTAGETQTMDFPPIPDQILGGKTIKLRARASSGLPVQFFVVSGPVTIAGDVLTVGKIPRRANSPSRNFRLPMGAEL